MNDTPDPQNADLTGAQPHPAPDTPDTAPEDRDHPFADFGEADQVLAVVAASAGRRVLGLASLCALGGMMLYIAFTNPMDVVWRLFLILCGGGAIWLAEIMRRGTASRVELTRDAVRDADGTIIARIEDITGMDRGVFAFKPSNGFLLKTSKATGPNMWRPGLWWRIGRRVGIGGMTPGNQSKFMAEIIAAMLERR